MTHFKGTVTEANGGLMHLTIAGPGHFIFNKSYTQSFDEPINLSKGSFTVSMSAATQGKFSFDVTDGHQVSIPMFRTVSTIQCTCTIWRCRNDEIPDLHSWIFDFSIDFCNLQDTNVTQAQLNLSKELVKRQSNSDAETFGGYLSAVGQFVGKEAIP